MADSNITKRALATSLKELMAEQPFAKINVAQICERCNMNRKSFYYHFKDIYDLVEWCCLEDARIALQGKKTSSTWHEGLLQIFDAVMENKPFILNVYRCVGREQIENYLFQLTCDLLMGVVAEKSKDIPITDEQKIFIADLYKYSFVGIMLDWIKNGMREDYREIADDTATALYGSIDNAIRNFAARNKTAEMHTE